MNCFNDNSSDEAEEDSDRELQVAFQSGLLNPLSLNIETDKPTFINDVAGIEQAIKDFEKKNLPWTERLDLSVDPAPNIFKKENNESYNDNESADDFKREMYFHRLAQSGVVKGIPMLNSFNIQTRRPEDYFAQMAKSDEHMKKVREKLLSKQFSIERSEKVKKLREMKKFGKKVQHDVIAKRQKEKKEMLEAVKKYRKGKSDDLNFLENDENISVKKKTVKNIKPNKKRELKNNRFGFGGQKKRSKYNSKDSVNNPMSDFNKRKNAKLSQKKGRSQKTRTKGVKRPGKSKRQKSKIKKR